MAPEGTPLPELLLYTRAGCHLCDDARDTIRTVLASRASARLRTPSLREVDIGGDPALEARYGDRIPVVALGTQRLELVIGARRLARLLERALDGVTAA